MPNDKHLTATRLAEVAVQIMFDLGFKSTINTWEHAHFPNETSFDILRREISTAFEARQ